MHRLQCKEYNAHNTMHRIKCIGELVKNSEKDSNCKNFAEMVESNHNFGSTIYFVIMTITSSGEKYILAQLHIMFIVSILKRKKFSFSLVLYLQLKEAQPG